MKLHKAVSGALIMAALWAAQGFTGQAIGQPIPEVVEKWRAADLRLGAHRGGRDLWPENTLLAFQEAAKRWPGALLEGDAHISADGEVVLIHDSTVDRTTNGTGPVAGMTLAELQKLDAGYKFTPDNGETYPQRGKGVVIPTLEEVLKAIPTHLFLIEIKGGDNAAALTVQAIRNANAENRVLLASINPLYINQVRALAPDIPTCYDYASAMVMLTTLRQGDWDNYQPDHLMLCASPTLVKQLGITPDEIQAIRKKGILYLVFTLNSEKALREHLTLGLDSILTDRPDLLADILTEEK